MLAAQIETLAAARNLTAEAFLQRCIKQNNPDYDWLLHFFDRSKDLLAISDASGNFIHFNNAWIEKLGYDRTLLAHTRPQDLIHPDDRSGTVNARAEVLGNHYLMNFENRYRHASGHYLWFSWTAVTDENALIYAIGRDITHEKQLEQAAQAHERELAASESRFRTLLDLAAEGILLLDKNGIIVLVNSYIEQIFGYTRDELIGQFVEILVPQNFREKHEQMRSEFITQGKSRKIGETVHIRGIRADGVIFPAEIGLTPVEISGERHMMCSIVDISERRQLEQHRIYTQWLEMELAKEHEVIELKERFVSMVSHEYRTPLTTILASVEILKRYMNKLTSEAIDNKLDTIREQVHRMIELMEDILTLSRNNHKGVEFRPEMLDLMVFCQQLYHDQTMINNNSRKFEMEVEHIPQLIHADKQILHHILTNLLSNAVKYSSENSTIHFRVRNKDSCIEFEVEDHGIGIPEADLEHLFEPFHRATNVRGIPGTGLGLAIVKQYVDTHGGTISVKSEIGKGTAFAVRIPFTDV